MSKNTEIRGGVINFPRQDYALATTGNNALKLDAISIPELKQQAGIVSIDNYRKADSGKEAQAFRTEFYKNATDRQIEDDIYTYLAEYRFEVDEMDYELDVVDGKLVDPASGESMVDKAQRAIDHRKKEGLNTSREVAEKKGLISFEKQLSKNGVAVWFSPPGPEEEGYGTYGFGYVGERVGDKIKMTAIRVENPTIEDFNRASLALWGKGDYEKAEDFLESPQVIDVSKRIIKEYIHGNFEIKDENGRQVFEKVRLDLAGAVEEFKVLVREGVESKVHTAVHALENMALKMKRVYEHGQESDNIIFLSKKIIPKLAQAMMMAEFNIAPAAVKGSCGISVKSQSNDILRGINTNADKTPTNNTRDFEFDQPGPCRLCERDVPCGPCMICEACNDKIDAGEQLAAVA